MVNENPSDFHSKRKEKDRQGQGACIKRHGGSNPSSISAQSCRNPINKSNNKPPNRNAEKPEVDVPRLSNELSRLIHLNKRNVLVKKPNVVASSGPQLSIHNNTTMNFTDNQATQIKSAVAECLQNISQARQRKTFEDKDFPLSLGIRSAAKNEIATPKVQPVPIVPIPAPVRVSEPSGKTSLLRSYLSGSNPPREEYVSKNRNVSNSLISSDSIHHSILLESGRERRQCLLQYLSIVVSDGQVVIYANSIPGVESLMSFLKKHGFEVNMVHSKMLMAESNWILSEYSLNKFSVLLCAEDHYHSCPAHFRWVKTIINYELPISNPLENWTTRNGIVEFSDNLPVHIYTFIKKTCPLDNELVKLLHLDADVHEADLLPAITEHTYSVK